MHFDLSYFVVQVILVVGSATQGRPAGVCDGMASVTLERVRLVALPSIAQPDPHRVASRLIW